MASCLPQLLGEVQYEARSFLDDVLACPCGGRLTQIAIITRPDIIDVVAAAIIMSNQAPARAPPSRRGRSLVCPPPPGRPQRI